MGRRLLRVARPGLLFLALAVGCGLIGGLATIVQWSAFAAIVARAFLGGEGLSALRAPFLLFLGAVGLRALLAWAREVLAQIGATRATDALRAQFVAQMQRLGPARLRQERTGAIIASATGGIDRLEPYFARFLPQSALSQLVPLLIAAAVWPRDWASAILLLATAPVLPILMILVGTYTEERINQQWLALTRLKTAFLDAIQGLPTIRTLGQTTLGQERVARQSETFRERTMRALRYAFLSSFVLEFITSVAIALVAVTLGLRLLAGGLAFEPAFLVLLLAPEFYRPLRELGTQHHAGMEGQAAAEQIFALLDRAVPDECAAGTNAPGGVSAPLVTLHDVRYTYPGAEHPALAGVTLRLIPGERVALVGPSGAGKSTIVNLLLGFLAPERGVIAADGYPLSDFSAEAWRERVALVPQRPYLFAGSVLDNLRIARSDATLEAAQAAATLAGADEFIAALPQGYDTPLGEGGARLSKGQAQRIAIARAFLKDAPVLILDEPTAHLDPASETLVRDDLERLAAGRTTLIVAHRFGTVRGADRIVVLDHGRVVETGTHEALSLAGGMYARLVHAAATDGATLAGKAVTA